jgi:hypothetical protein
MIPITRIRHAALAAVAAFSCACSAPAAEPTVQLDIDGRRVVGTPLSWSDSQVLLLARDGRLWDFAPARAKNFRKMPTAFHGHSAAELRGVLQAEFGKKYEVTGAGQYLVVHPAGQKQEWAKRFDELYRSFVHYFSVRGFTPRPPRFPLVAVVLANRDEFSRYAAREGGAVRESVLGYYSPTTNRVLMYDFTAGDEPGQQVNLETIIHEATHQVAFNLGVHNRFAPTPRLAAEGLGTMFEAPGVWNARHHPKAGDRLNRYRLDAFRRYAATRRKKGALAELIASDRLFQTDPEAAYAEAWAATFFLAEVESRKYASWLKKLAARPDFQEYSGSARLKDFTDIFGGDLGMLEARMLRYIPTLK